MPSTRPYNQEFQITLAAGEVQTVYQIGRSIGVVALAGDVGLSIDDSPESVMRGGFIYELNEGERFEKLRLHNKGVGAASLTLLISEGTFKDNRFSTIVAIKTYSGDVLTDSPAVNVDDTVTLIVPADNQRTSLMIQNTDPFVSVWIGAATVDAGALRGIELRGEESITLETTAAVYGQCLTGQDVDVSILEIKQ
jgi:hypothetical protein